MEQMDLKKNLCLKLNMFKNKFLLVSIHFLYQLSYTGSLKNRMPSHYRAHTNIHTNLEMSREYLGRTPDYPKRFKGQWHDWLKL